MRPEKKKEREKERETSSFRIGGKIKISKINFPFRSVLSVFRCNFTPRISPQKRVWFQLRGGGIGAEISPIEKSPNKESPNMESPNKESPTAEDF